MPSPQWCALLQPGKSNSLILFPLFCCFGCCCCFCLKQFPNWLFLNVSTHFSFFGARFFMYCTESWFIGALGLHDTPCLKFIIHFNALSKVIMDYCYKRWWWLNNTKLIAPLLPNERLYFKRFSIETMGQIQTPKPHER